jgi:mono/diheme cytochrome c family protein
MLAAGLMTVLPLSAPAQAPAAPSRGELLYATHCIACHTREIHWRQKRLATDWASLEAEVRRWAKNAGLGWTDDEVADVARYLNESQYRFAAPRLSVLRQRVVPDITARLE